MMNGRRALLLRDFPRDSSASFGFSRFSFLFGFVVMFVFVSVSTFGVEWYSPLMISCGSFAMVSIMICCSVSSSVMEFTRSMSIGTIDWRLWCFNFRPLIYTSTLRRLIQWQH